MAGAVAPPAFEWRDVTLELGAFAVRDVSLCVTPGCWLCVVGPTGAGKSLVLEIAAGFLRPTRGRLLRNGTDVTTAPPERRGIAYVPQDELLFPHLDVRANLLYGVRAPREAALARMHALAAELGIAHLLARRIRTISGGEAQRVALGRGLLSGDDLLLLDECTSALDEATRATVGQLLLEERRCRNLSVVHVTHDPAEADRLADVIVTLGAGRIARIETRRRDGWIRSEERASFLRPIGRPEPRTMKTGGRS